VRGAFARGGGRAGRAVHAGGPDGRASNFLSLRRARGRVQLYTPPNSVGGRARGTAGLDGLSAGRWSIRASHTQQLAAVVVVVVGGG